MIANLAFRKKHESIIQKNILKRSTPRIEPWETTAITSVQLPKEPFSEILWCLLLE